MKTLKWFQNRINKRIFRNKTSCKCDNCNDVFKNGIVVGNKNHAEYLFSIQGELNINYRDKL